MRQYFESQADSEVVYYYLRVSNPESVYPVELHTKTAKRIDLDVLASEVKFVEYVFHPKLGCNLPIFEAR